MNILKVRLHGTAPLLMSSCSGANPMDPISRAVKLLTSKRNKTEEDHVRLLELDWANRVYHMDKYELLKPAAERTLRYSEEGPYIPSESIEAMLRDAAKKVKRGSGKDMIAAVMVTQERIPITYEGPRNITILSADPMHMDARNVVIQRARLLRGRPRFNTWNLEFDIRYDEHAISSTDLVAALQRGGMVCGLGDYRPKYGRFNVEVVSDRVERETTIATVTA